MTLTSEQITLLRMEIGDTDGVTFSDEELQAIHAAAGASWDGTLYAVYRILTANAAKLHDYTAGETEEKRSQVFSHLLMLRDRYAKAAASADKAANTVRLVSMQSTPIKRKRKPRGF